MSELKLGSTVPKVDASKKEEENIKFLSQRIPKNKSAFLKLNVIMGAAYLVLLVLDICLL